MTDPRNTVYVYDELGVHIGTATATLSIDDRYNLSIADLTVQKVYVTPYGPRHAHSISLLPEDDENHRKIPLRR